MRPAVARPPFHLDPIAHRGQHEFSETSMSNSPTPTALLDGVLLVDKPAGPTSHDIVARLRRTLGTRAVGHAGTLDPAATGLLLMAIGEGTKLVAHLTGHDKKYLAEITWGRSTSTLDAEGETIAEAPIPLFLCEEL